MWNNEKKSLRGIIICGKIFSLLGRKIENNGLVKVQYVCEHTNGGYDNVTDEKVKVVYHTNHT